MPDADWVRYKQIRGDDLPQLGRWLGSSYQLERVLKRDFYAIVGLYRKQPDSAASDRSSRSSVHSSRRAGTTGRDRRGPDGRGAAFFAAG